MFRLRQRLGHLVVQPIFAGRQLRLLPGLVGLVEPILDDRRAETDRQHQQGSPQGRGRGIPLYPLHQSLPGPHRSRVNRFARLEAAQVLGQIGRAGVAFPRFLPQAFQANRLQIARQPWIQLPRRHRLLLHHLGKGLQQRRRLERWPARQAFIQDRPQGIDVTGRTERGALAAGLLRGHVRRRAHHRARGCLPGDVQLLGQAEVGDLRCSILGQEHIARLEVPVDNSPGVRGMHRQGQFLHQRRGFLGRQGRAGQLSVQGAARAVFQREERQAVVFAHLENLHDVGVLQTGDGLGLDAEALQLLRSGAGAGADHFEGNQALERPVPGLVNDAHAAPAQLFQDLISGNQNRNRGWNSPAFVQRAHGPRRIGFRRVRLDFLCNPGKASIRAARLRSSAARLHQGVHPA